MATVKMYSPTGNAEVIDENDVEKRLQAGYITHEAGLAEKEAQARQKYQEWLVSPDSVQERFRMLRGARDMKISATDYLMESDYPITNESKQLLIAYRQALRDLPSQIGAPWDGGGELTPWPAMPGITKIS